LAHASVLARHGDGLRASVDFLVRQPGVDANRIGVLGLSMGVKRR